MRAPSPPELAEHLKAPPGSKERFGASAEAVQDTARLVAAAAAAWDKETIAAFQDQERVHAKVWGKLIAIASSTNLDSFKEFLLPASYTALYALVVMKPQELEAAKAEGLLKVKALSSRMILDWTKAYRMRGTGIEQEIPLTLVLMDDLSEGRYQALLENLRNIADEFNAELLEGRGGVRQSGLKSDQRREVAKQIENEIRFATSGVILDAPEELRVRFSIHSPEDLVAGTLAQFTGFFQLLEDKTPWMFWRKYGRLYCLKIAHDFNVSDSRAERYQFKKRIRSAKEKCADDVEDFDAIADEILQTYMK
jgi:hypothetical protein